MAHNKLFEGDLWQRNAAVLIESIRASIFGSGTRPLTSVGTSGSTATLGGSLFNTFADVGSVGTTETDLFTYTIPANAFATNGDKLQAEYGIAFVNSTATRQTKLKLAGATIFDTGALTVSAAGSLILRVTLMRSASGAVRYSITAETTSASVTTFATVASTTATLTGSLILKVTGQSGGVGSADNDLVGRISSGLWFPAA